MPRRSFRTTDDPRGIACTCGFSLSMARLRSRICGPVLLCCGFATALPLLAASTSADAKVPVLSAIQLTVPAPYQDFVAQAARQFAIPADWIAAVMRVESNGYAKAVSSKGALGLMQIMPTTWLDLRSRYQLGADPFDPRDNILAGAAYLQMLHERYGAPGFLAAYNAGLTRYEAHLLTGLPLPEETTTYLARLDRLLPDPQAARPFLSMAGWRRPPFPLVMQKPAGALPLTAAQAASLQRIAASIAVVAALVSRSDLSADREEMDGR